MPVSFELLGGFRAALPWAVGTFAVDWLTRKMWMVGHVHEQTIAMFELPEEIGSGNPQDWPVISPIYTSGGWWRTKKESASGQYCNGLWYDGMTVWAVCRAFYDTDPSSELTVYGMEGSQWTVPLAQQKFSGWVKFPPGQGAYLGCGGYESGQGTCSGPTVGEVDGNVILEYDWLELPGDNLKYWKDVDGNVILQRGDNLKYWNTRAPRLPDYSVSQDTWLGWQPREVNGAVQGRWASDFLYGGGIILPEQGLLCFFPYQGTGELRYSWDGQQYTQTFARDEWHNRTRLLAYSWPGLEIVDFSTEMGFRGPVSGQEIDPDGIVWLAETNAWGDSEVLLRAYRVTY